MLRVGFKSGIKCREGGRRTRTGRADKRMKQMLWIVIVGILIHVVVAAESAEKPVKVFLLGRPVPGR